MLKKKEELQFLYFNDPGIWSEVLNLHHDWTKKKTKQVRHFEIFQKKNSVEVCLLLFLEFRINGEEVYVEIESM